MGVVKNMNNTIYLEGNEDLINNILETARSNLGEGINVISLVPSIPKHEVLDELNKLRQHVCTLCEDEVDESIKELEK